MQSNVEKLRIELIEEIILYINQHHLTQTSAARLLGSHQSRVFDLVHRHHEKFRVDSLIRMANKPGLVFSIKSS